MSESPEWFDPRATVFMIWGFFILVFVCLPSRKYVARLCGLNCGDDEDEEYRSQAGGNENHRHSTDYESLSRERREELDNLRAFYILQKLCRFTAEMKPCDMLRRSSDGQCIAVDTNDASAPKSETENKDIECGDDAPGPPQESGCNGDGASDEEAPSLYTHVSIPRAGVAMDQNGNMSCIDHDGKAKGPSHDALTKRDAPVFCAICLAEYDVKDRLCWSSNPECTHVFHEDCILQWLVSLGRMKSKRQMYSENPTPNQILRFPLECPCCRQDFVSTSASLEIEDSAETSGDSSVDTLHDV